MRSSARIAARSQFSPGCYNSHVEAGCTAQCPLRRHFYGSIPSGTLCAAIPLSKSCARKSSCELAYFFVRLSTEDNKERKDSDSDLTAKNPRCLRFLL